MISNIWYVGSAVQPRSQVLSPTRPGNEVVPSYAAIRPGLLEAWLVLTSVKYHGNLYILIPLNQRLALTRLRATGPRMIYFTTAGLPRSGKSQGKRKIFQGQGKVRDLKKKSGKIFDIVKVSEKSGNSVFRCVIISVPQEMHFLSEKMKSML